MCLSQPKMKSPPPVAPPPPPDPSAVELEEPSARRKKPGEGSALEGLRMPLNSTGLPRTPRIGL